MNRILIAVIGLVLALFTLGATSEDGKLNINFDNFPSSTNNQQDWFVTASGSGDCSSWSNPCTFRTAVAKCTDSVQDMIWMSPEDHDTDNGSDGTGTDITAKNVRIIGSGISRQFATRFFNGHATASIVITASGHRIAFENLRFTQESKTDVDVTYLSITGSRSVIYYCDFRSATGAVSDVGILYSNGSQYHYAFNNYLRNFTDAGIRMNEADHAEMEKISFEANTVAIDFTHVNDGPFKIVDSIFKNCTTGINIVAGVAGVAFTNPIFLDCTTNIGTVGDYDVLHLVGIHTTHSTVGTYPANAGVVVTGGVAAYAQGVLTEIVPASTITKPFFLQGINIQDASVTDISKLELFYGEASGSAVSLGVFEFVSDRKTGISISGIDVSAFPANAYVGAKLATATGGSDTVTLTLSYQSTD